ncbi:MAG: clan AA aspartic protease [Hormoscilla sp.]
MGLVYADIELINGGDLAVYRRGYISTDQIKRCQVKALVDRSAYLLAIPESIKIQLDLPKLEEQVASLADNSRISLDIVGPVEVRFENLRTTVDALVLPDGSEVLLGGYSPGRHGCFD